MMMIRTLALLFLVCGTLRAEEKLSLAADAFQVFPAGQSTAVIFEGSVVDTHGGLFSLKEPTRLAVPPACSVGTLSFQLSLGRPPGFPLKRGRIEVDVLLNELGAEVLAPKVRQRVMEKEEVVGAVGAPTNLAGGFYELIVTPSAAVGPLEISPDFASFFSIVCD